MKTSWKDLGLLFLLVGMGMLVFGSLEYYIENEEEDTGFTSIPQVIYLSIYLSIYQSISLSIKTNHYKVNLWALFNFQRKKNKD